ncbi:MAG: orotate phosphoribosyltransferase [Bacteroidales bacterium]|nr:orotate phosphoribosyltransferase [Bacteroidales bacterium]
MKNEQIIANHLLQINAIKLNPAKPFTWASGWKSPIYCDNRKTLSYPEIRTAICESFVQTIEKQYNNIDGIAAVATGAIGIGALVAQKMNLPLVYIRASSKGHGLENRIEGAYSKGQRYVVVEDLISTGKSSLSAVDALKQAGCTVLGMVAIFTYNFQQAVDNFVNADCKLTTLSDYNHLIDAATESGYIKEDQVELLKDWRNNPSTWMQNS